MHINHQRGEGHNRRKAADYPYNDSSYHQGIQAAARKARRREGRERGSEGVRAYRDEEAHARLDAEVESWGDSAYTDWGR